MTFDKDLLNFQLGRCTQFYQRFIYGVSGIILFTCFSNLASSAECTLNDVIDYAVGFGKIETKNRAENKKVISNMP